MTRKQKIQHYLDHLVEPGNVRMFNKMYPDGLDAMTPGKLKNALRQCEATINKLTRDRNGCVFGVREEEHGL